MTKKELLNKIQNLNPSDVKKLGFSIEEINFIKKRLLNDKLGLQLNFNEIDEELDKNYLGLEEVKDLNINLSQERERERVIFWLKVKTIMHSRHYKLLMSK